MPGYQRIHKNNYHTLWLLLIFSGLSLLWGCKSSEEAKKIQPKSNLKEFLSKYEGTFDPKEFDMNIDSVRNELKLQHDAMDASKLVTVAIPETIPGYRVQVLFTPDIEQANQTRDSLTNLLPQEWTYTVYDAPYYKIRVGNYIDRTSANQMVKILVGFGYQDAWIVPDKIIKNPPQRLPDVEIVPDKQPPNPQR
jgi:hypothetical protein